MKSLAALLLAALANAQSFSQRGFVEWNTDLYPQTAPGDSGRLVGGALLRYEASYKAAPGLSFFGGVDARTDTHREVKRDFHLSWQDREVLRPAFEIRRLGLTYSKGGFTLSAGKQLIRWGKADLLNPTDHFAPRDYLSVYHNDFLPVMAASLSYSHASDTVELVYTPLFTPSRTPLLRNRWAPVPAEVSVLDGGARLPGGPQFGVRWNHAGSRVEYSLSAFEGYNHLPVIVPTLVSLTPPTVSVLRLYPRIRSYGGEAAVPLKWFTIKTETAFYDSPDRFADRYVLYVAQLERQKGEWFFTGGYAGESVVERRAPLTFAPDRGLARTFLGRAGYTIDSNRSVAVEGAVRDNGEGSLLKLEYSQAVGQHWRITAGSIWIRGSTSDFLGQYHRNSNFYLTIRYSF